MKTMLEIYEAGFKGFEDSSFTSESGDSWPAAYLYDKVKELGLKAEKINLRHIDLSSLPWQDGQISNIDCFAYHAVRIQNCDTSIPVIMRSDGLIVDGWHRVVKAILEDKTHIKAYRFESYIPPIEK